MWPAELHGPAAEKVRLRQALAWLVAAGPGLGVLFPLGAGPVMQAPVLFGCLGRASV